MLDAFQQEKQMMILWYTDIIPRLLYLYLDLINNMDN